MECKTDKHSIASFKADIDSSLLDTSPEYQRQSDVWNMKKKQLFLHTLFAKYDCPKIYIHKLAGEGKYVYALVDGKQRLDCICEFMAGRIKLGNFAHEPSDLAGKKIKPYPKAGDCFTDLPASWKIRFQNISLDTVFISDAENLDIEELFSRLNNGEPLKGAEARNAFGGKMCKLIREIAKHDFFTKKVSLSNKRLQHHDMAAYCLLIEDALLRTGSPYLVLKKPGCDKLAKDKLCMSDDEYNKLKRAVHKQLNVMIKIFDDKDNLLKKTGEIKMYYLFAKAIRKEYAGANLFSNMNEFIPIFELRRTCCRKLTPEQKKEGGEEDYPYLDEFERLTGQSNDKVSLIKRVATMRRFFMERYPETKLRDSKRNFSDSDRYLIYIGSGKKCEKCGKPFRTYKDFQADHVIQWAHGGETALNNARALCKPCNAKLNKKVA